MEKKGTKIAYFVACAVFVVLLVVLGISFKGAPLPEFVIDGETVQAETPFAGTFWSLLPPIVAIALALISKEVYSSLFLGCLVGALLYTSSTLGTPLLSLSVPTTVSYPYWRTAITWAS